jgi:hypothetical protein
MAKKTKNATSSSVSTAVTNPGAVFNNITIPQPSGERKAPKLSTIEVGPFRLPGVEVDLNQYSAEQAAEMIAWARENGAYVIEDKGLFSWKKTKMRDWFILRWT